MLRRMDHREWPLLLRWTGRCQRLPAAGTCLFTHAGDVNVAPECAILPRRENQFSRRTPSVPGRERQASIADLRRVIPVAARHRVPMEVIALNGEDSESLAVLDRDGERSVSEVDWAIVFVTGAPRSTRPRRSPASRTGSGASGRCGEAAPAGPTRLILQPLARCWTGASRHLDCGRRRRQCEPYR